MKRRAFTVLSLSFLCLMFVVQVSRAQSTPEVSKSNPEIAIKDIDITKLLSYFYQLWKDSAFGNDPNRTERAAWIIRKNDGTIEFVRWPRSGAWAREVWVCPPPQNIVAQAHTHPLKRDPKPWGGLRRVQRQLCRTQMKACCSLPSPPARSYC